ncbi:serine/arginine repetitive matrix protein 2-like [Numida meleagris]|uniref:serine/arginine repetitive matrix protein 2-like n=1 Tax=Numida meleagris TaxID=8996 RepID=UPI000B3DED1C|nr:serine/arginine repetitive matrix protein 2-like [Numida meleagris]XP_021236906.1 serine/arginine repetitive matrix protein 2-like [Numida meleagris]
MSKRKQKTSNLEEEVCMLCRRADVHPDICGPTLSKSGICVHKFCLFFANGLYEQSTLTRVALEFPLDVIRSAIEEAEQKHCFVCGERGASICCAETACERSFHLPCAMDGECIMRFFGQHRSYCCEHRPEQVVGEEPEQDTKCIICLEPVGDKKSYHTMVCPVCTQAWFHRSCIQGQAINAGILRFRCPVCRDRTEFVTEMQLFGIQIPARRPTWEDQESYAVLHERHSRCDVSECLYTEGREQAEEEGPWQLLLCISCAGQGTHRHCSSLSDSTTTWECDICAGVGTASSAKSQLAGPSTASQEAEGPSHSSPAPHNDRSDSTSQAAAESSRSSQLPEHSSQSSRPRTRQRKSCIHVSNQHQGHQGSSHTPAPGAESSTHGSTSQREVGHSRNSPAAERRRQPRQQGTSKTRSRSPLKGRASNSPSQLRRSRGSRRPPASRGAESSTHGSTSQREVGHSRNSPAAERRKQPRQQGTSKTRSRSPLKGRASNSPSQLRRSRGSRRTPASGGAESSTHGSTSQRVSRNSLGAGNVKCDRQQDTSQRQSHSSLQGLASNSSSEPRRHRGTRCMPAPGAESSTHSSARQATSGSSRDSLLPEHRRRSKQRGQTQARSRSPRERQPSNSQRQSGGRHGRGSRQRRPSRARSRSRVQP